MKENGISKQDSFLLFFGSSGHVKRWEDQVGMTENQNNPGYFNDLKTKHKNTYVDVSVQEIFENIKISLYDDDGVCQKYAERLPVAQGLEFRV